MAHNVGDDFVREGLLHLIRHARGERPLKVSCIHKHAPVTARHGYEWVRRKELSWLLDLPPLDPRRDRVLGCDLLVQSGAPVYWSHVEHRCSDNEWYRPLIGRRYQRIRDQASFVNLAAGSCQPYRSDGRELAKDAAVARYARELHELAAVTTVRDRVAQDALHGLGLDPPLLPCASIFARDQLQVDPQEPEFLALNFMPLAGHYDLGQGIRARRWRDSFRTFYQHARRQLPCVFVCHDRREVRAARGIDPNARIFHSRNAGDYLRLYARARAGILNRVHGALAIASFGRPAHVIGNDTRARMIEPIGLGHDFVDETDAEVLVRILDRTLDRGRTYGDRFGEIKEGARSAYRSALARVPGLGA